MFEYLLKDVIKMLQTYFSVFLSTKKVYKNWSEIFFHYFQKRKKFNLQFRTSNEKITVLPSIVEGIVYLVKNLNFNPYNFYIKNKKVYYKDREIITDSISTLYLSANGWKKEENVWINDNFRVKFKNVSFSICEIFHLKIYDYCDFKGREIVDIGANIGDSAIYFAINGAKKVYAFEPLPSIYKLMIENIRSNNLENKIIAFNAAVLHRRGKIKVPSNIPIEESGSFKINDNNIGEVEVPVYSLKDVLQVIHDPYLIKLDCEGCEIELILKDNSIKSFEKIVFEYHCNQNWKLKYLIIRKLNKLGFKCKDKKQFKLGQGIIYCEKL